MSTTRTLWLLRHAKSDWDTGVPDHQRPLNGRGRRDAYAAGELLVARSWRPDLVLCSSATRTRETWERAVTGGASATELAIEPSIYEASVDTLLGLVQAVDPAVHRLLLVGHAPGVPGLVDRLGHRPEPADVWRRLDENYPTAGLAMLEFDTDWADLDTGSLVAFEVPRG